MRRNIESLKISDSRVIRNNQVIQSAHNAIKQLVENSLDAGATSIEIYVLNNFRNGFRVTDNGHGIADLENICLMNTTSKIKTDSDIESVKSYGFRGQALAALCGLAKLEIWTRIKGDKVGKKVKYDESGSVLSTDEILFKQHGTTVLISSLFQNLPVRCQELERAGASQIQKSLNLLIEYALIMNHCSFRFTHENKDGKKNLLLRTQGTGIFSDTITKIYGSGFMESLAQLKLKIDSVTPSLCVEGYVTKELSSKIALEGTQVYRDVKIFSVNGRPIDPSRRMINALSFLY